MRVVLIGIVGGAAALVAFGLSRMGHGLLHAGSFVSSLFLAALTVGLVVAALVSVWLDRARLARRARPARRLRGATCGSCGRPLAQRDVLWVCPTCDAVLDNR